MKVESAKDKILLFIPMYNCEKQIVRVLGQLDSEVLNYIDEILIVNNRSTDGGEKAAVDFCLRHPQLPVSIVRNDENYGLGGSHKVAFGYAAQNSFDYIIVLHGDDQGNIHEFIPLLKSGEYKEMDCCLGSRFMKGSKLIGYSKIRVIGNYGFNLLFSILTGRHITDLGSGLNMYKVQTLKSGYYMKYPDTLYFNDFMILASCYYKQIMKFYPISWREEDQVSNNRLVKFSISLLKMLFNYTFFRKTYFEKDLRDKFVEKYTYIEIFRNRGGKE